jgi:hypothetical protein
MTRDRTVRDIDAYRAWIRGPLMDTCSGLPGPESRRACILVFTSILDEVSGQRLTHDDHFRIELAKAKAFDEIRQLWTRVEQETWLRGPKTTACRQAPFPTHVRNCLESVQKNLDDVRHADDLGVDPPEVRAERAVARIEEKAREGVTPPSSEAMTPEYKEKYRLLGEEARALREQQAREQDREDRREAARMQALGMFLGSRPFSFQQPMPAYQPPPPIQYAPVYQAPPVRPPVNCTSNRVGDSTYTNCN